MKNEFEARDELIEKRKNINTVYDLKNYIEDVEKKYNYDYGVAPIAIAQATLATAWYLAKEMGITGFQSSFVMWDFIRDWSYSDNVCGLKLVNYDDMLYPQYEHKFNKTISKDILENLQKQAKKNLEEKEFAHPNVIAHWKSIVDGNVPFGYKVVN